MSNPIATRPNEIQWEEFLDRGFLIQGPDSNTIWGGIGQSDSGDLSFFHTKFFQDKIQSFGAQSWFQLELNQLLDFIDSKHLELAKLERQGDNDQTFVQEVAQVIDRIKNDENLEKVVPVAWANYHISGHPFSRLRDLSKLGGGLYGYWECGKGILGCSPEVLYNRNSDLERFQVLAGTAKKEDADLLLLSQKDLFEHKLVIDDIKQKLGNDSALDVGLTHTRFFGSLAHLETWIERPRTKFTEQKLIEQLHPTAALGGFPRKYSLSLLKEMSHYQIDREERLFGGLFGLTKPDLSFAYVGIRNIQWDNKKAIISSGCGVVEQSDPKSELEEIQNKRRTIESIFL